MGKKICCAAVLWIMTLLLSLLWGVHSRAETGTKQVDVLFTHDTHSHLESFSSVENGEKIEWGGFAGIRTLIAEQLEKNPDTLIVDAGDFSMGTLIQTIYDTEATEIRMLGEMGYDVTTFGNHEFDYHSKGIADMLVTAKDSGDVLPEIVVCNVDWETMHKQGLSENQQMLWNAFEQYGVKDYVILTKGDMRIAVFGVFGIDSLKYAPTCELLFKNPIEAAGETVARIKAKENVDLIVCVSHSGTNEIEKDSEDENLAKSVPDIDLIVSGHTHTLLEEPIVHGDTSIVSCGEYGKHLGSLTLQQKDNGRWELLKYELIPVTCDIAEDTETKAKVTSFVKCVDEHYLAQFGCSKDQVLAENQVAFGDLNDLLNSHEEQNMGSILADSYAYGVEHTADYDGIPVDVTIVPAGLIRDTFAVGDITVENVFNAFSLGIGEDGTYGYPLVSMYLSGKDLKTVAEIDASLSDYMKTARLYCYGLYFTYNPHRPILNKVTDCYLKRADGIREEIEDDRLYRVVADLYSVQMLNYVTEMSHGLLSIEPKDADGTAVTEVSRYIVHDGDRELKAWVSIAEYLDSFADTDGDGTGDVPEIYNVKQGRKIMDDSRNLWKLMKNPNCYTLILFIVIIILALLFVLFIVKIRKWILREGHKS